MMGVLAPAGICLVAVALLVFPGGDCVPSPLRGHRYVFVNSSCMNSSQSLSKLNTSNKITAHQIDQQDVDIDTGEHLPDVHHREARKTGRGNSLDNWACDTITEVPSDVRTSFPLDTFYQKYTHAYGVPIVSSSEAADAALTRACYTVRFLLADRRDIRDAMYDQYGRVAVIAQTEETTDIPEHSYLGDAWNDRARGLGGTANNPVTSDGAENILCESYLQDRWYEEDVLIHEFAHSIHLVSLNRINASFQPSLQDIYNMAKADGLWSNTYAISNFREYFAEGVQGFFNVQTCRSFRDNVHNDICTRDLLRDYDPRLYDLIVEVFPCLNEVVDRCNSDQDAAANQAIGMNCDEIDTTTETATVSGARNTGVMGSVTSSTTGNTTDSAATTSQSGPGSTHIGWRQTISTLAMLAIGCLVMN